MVTVGVAAAAAGAGALLGILLAHAWRKRSRARLEALTREVDASLATTARRLELALERTRPERAREPRPLEQALLEAVRADALERSRNAF